MKLSVLSNYEGNLYKFNNNLIIIVLIVLF